MVLSLRLKALLVQRLTRVSRLIDNQGSSGYLASFLVSIGAMSENTEPQSWQGYLFRFINQAIRNYQKLWGFLTLVMIGELLYLKYGLPYIIPYIQPPSIYLCHVLVLLFIILALYQRVKFPINPRKKTGIFLAISNRYADEEARKFLKKIYYEVEKTLASTFYGNQFNIVLLDEYKSQKIIKGNKQFIENTSRLLPSPQYSNWHFILYGDLQKDTRGGQFFYKLEPEYIVRHKIIPHILSESLGRDFKKYLKTQPWELPVSEGFLALKTFSLNIKENALFALGAAAYVSGSINIARRLHEDLYMLIKPRVDSEDHLKPLLKKLDNLLSMENHIMANYYSGKGDINAAIGHQERSISHKSSYRAHLFLATHYYEKGLDYLPKVEEHLKIAEQNAESSAHKLSRAYILMDKDNDYKAGTDLYIEALRIKTIPKDILLGTIEFLIRQDKLQIKPYRIFVQGLIYHLGLQDKANTRFCFDKCIAENNDAPVLIYMTEKAKLYLQEVQQ